MARAIHFSSDNIDIATRAKVEEGSSVAVWGLGAVGLAVIQAAKMSKV